LAFKSNSTLKNGYGSNWTASANIEFSNRTYQNQQPSWFYNEVWDAEEILADVNFENLDKEQPHETNSTLKNGSGNNWNTSANIESSNPTS
jgi:hypothetical protein